MFPSDWPAFKHIDFSVDYARRLKALLRVLGVEQQAVAASGAAASAGRPTADSTAAIDEPIGHSHERPVNAPWDPLLHPVSLSEGQAADEQQAADSGASTIEEK